LNGSLSSEAFGRDLRRAALYLATEQVERQDGNGHRCFRPATTATSRHRPSRPPRHPVVPPAQERRILMELDVEQLAHIGLTPGEANRWAWDVGERGGALAIERRSSQSQVDPM